MINEKYSLKDFTNRRLNELPAEDFSDTTIVGTCFYVESNDAVKTFPDGAKNIAFERCNLDNIVLPEGSTIDDAGSTRMVVSSAN